MLHIYQLLTLTNIMFAEIYNFYYTLMREISGDYFAWLLRRIRDT